MADSFFQATGTGGTSFQANSLAWRRPSSCPPTGPQNISSHLQKHRQKMGIKISSKPGGIFLHHAATSNDGPGGSAGSDPDPSGGSGSVTEEGGSGSGSEPSPQASL